MKTITFEGKQYEVEDWVNWMCKDSNCAVWAYENKPAQLEHSFHTQYGKRKHIGYHSNWTESLTKV